MKKIFIIPAIMLCIILGNTQTLEQDNPSKGFIAPMQHKPYDIEDMAAKRKAEMEKRKAEIDRRLGVTEEQKKELKAIHDKAKDEIAPKIKQLTEVEYEINTLEKKQISKEFYNVNTLENVQLSGKTIEQLRSEQKSLKEDIRKIKMAQFEKSQKVFTEEQKKELEKMRMEHEKSMKKAGRKEFVPMPIK